MGMTREEAREWFEEHIPTKIMPVAKRAYEIAIDALTPPTQEQVEKMWRGEWLDYRETSFGVPKRLCSRCGSGFIGFDTKFCENCGAPMTDEAVEMVMERWEALKDG